MSKLTLRLIVNAVLIVIFMALLVYVYTVIGFTSTQAILAVINLVFGMICAVYFALEKSK